MKSSLLISGALSMAMLTACTPQQWIERRVESAVTNAMDEISRDSVDVRRKPGTQLRIATFNTSMFDDADSGLLTRLRSDDANIRHIATVIRTVRPDVVLLNEFDYVADGSAVDLFRTRFLQASVAGTDPITYPYRYIAPVNTGVPSGLDLDNNGQVGGDGRSAGNDAWGYGLHPGQYGMVVLSRYPIDAAAVRTFQNLKWSAMPQAMKPVDPTTGKDWYSAKAWGQLRLSSKSHWDVPVFVNGKTVHVLASHPTPPVFDGPERRNRNRNHDEIRLWREYLDNAATSARWLCDDRGHCGGLAADRAFVIMGDQNADPDDGDGVAGAVRQILDHPRAQTGNAPRSAGATLTALDYGKERKGDVSTHTGDFGPQAGTLRLDYVIPSKQFEILGQGVFWPLPKDPQADATTASDHHMVWMDLRFGPDDSR